MWIFNVVHHGLFTFLYCEHNKIHVHYIALWNCIFNLNGMHSNTSQKIIFFYIAIVWMQKKKEQKLDWTFCQLFIQFQWWGKPYCQVQEGRIKGRFGGWSWPQMDCLTISIWGEIDFPNWHNWSFKPTARLATSLSVGFHDCPIQFSFQYEQKYLKKIFPRKLYAKKLALFFTFFFFCFLFWCSPQAFLFCL